MRHAGERTAGLGDLGAPSRSAQPLGGRFLVTTKIGSPPDSALSVAVTDSSESSIVAFVTVSVSGSPALDQLWLKGAELGVTEDAVSL